MAMSEEKYGQFGARTVNAGQARSSGMAGGRSPRWRFEHVSERGRGASRLLRFGGWFLRDHGTHRAGADRGNGPESAYDMRRKSLATSLTPASLRPPQVIVTTASLGQPGRPPPSLTSSGTIIRRAFSATPSASLHWPASDRRQQWHQHSYRAASFVRPTTNMPRVVPG